MKFSDCRECWRISCTIFQIISKSIKDTQSTCFLFLLSFVKHEQQKRTKHQNFYASFKNSISARPWIWKIKKETNSKVGLSVTIALKYHKVSTGTDHIGKQNEKLKKDIWAWLPSLLLSSYEAYNNYWTMLIDSNITYEARLIKKNTSPIRKLVHASKFPYILYKYQKFREINSVVWPMIIKTKRA